MGAILITGGSGAGKTTMAAELARRGLRTVDTDNDPGLARFVDPAGREVRMPPEPDFDWLARHSWDWRADRLAELVAGADPIFLCGNASNEIEFFGLFARVFLLAIDEATMLRRIDDPLRDNDFGRVGDTREQLCRWLPDYQARLRALAAVTVVDATAGISEVADAILAALCGGAH